jgi:hypothetical protein
MERIITAIETIEANSARMFGLEDERTQVVFMLTDSLRTLFENEEAVAGSPATEHGVVCFNDLLELNEEEAQKVIADLSEEQKDAFVREGFCKLLEEIFG